MSLGRARLGHSMRGRRVMDDIDVATRKSVIRFGRRAGKSLISRSNCDRLRRAGGWLDPLSSTELRSYRYVNSLTQSALRIGARSTGAKDTVGAYDRRTPYEGLVATCA
jgi:hypothetical protein